VSRVHRYIEVMYDLLLRWLDDEKASYEGELNMLNSASDFILAGLARAPQDARPCDNGFISVEVFVDYVFEDDLWPDDIIWGELDEKWQVGSVEDAKKLVKCYEELVKFKKALKNNIKVKIVEGVVLCEQKVCFDVG
jgi:hypothetical protein